MKKIYLLILFCSCHSAFSQSPRRHTLSGTITDVKNGEELVGATVYVAEARAGVSTNSYGFFSISLPPGNYHIAVTYIGYETKKLDVDFNTDNRLKIELKEEERKLKEVVVQTDRADARHVSENKMSVVKMDIKQVKKIPLLLGEVDIIKAVQLLPGVQSAGDGSSNFVVRGGNIDHNLVLLDEAVVYNPSHVFGFFSTFNGDAIKDFDLYKGGIPSQFGGRLASVLDVRMKDGNAKEFNASGGVGVLFSRLTLEGPLPKKKGSFMIAGRRSYFDIFFPLSKDLDGVAAYFYDLNMKLNYILGDKDKFFLSGYMGRDKLAFGELVGFGWGNITTTARWNHIFSNKLFVNTTLSYSRYDYNVDFNIAKNLNSTRINYINDLNLKIDGSYYLSPRNSFKFGIKQNYYVFEPGLQKPITAESIIPESSLPTKRAYEQDYYLSHIVKMGARATVEYGGRISVFSNMGTGRSINYIGSPTYIDNGFVKEGQKDTINMFRNYKAAEIYNTYYGIEPRMNFTYLLNSSTSLKCSYNRMFQYMQLIQNITASVGQEFWTPSDKYLKPQQSDQIAAGVFKNFRENTIEFSAEVYYKWLRNTVELRDNADIQFNEAIESQLVAGKGRAYGIEFFARKQTGNTTGWISYTLAKSERQADFINNGEWYPFRYDRRHYLTIVISQTISKRVTLGASFVYGSGLAFTMPTSAYQLFGDPKIVPDYGSRNSARYPEYHRLDLSVTLLQKKNSMSGLGIGKLRIVKFKAPRPYEGSVVFSLYNAYGRKNTYTIDSDVNNSGSRVLYQWYLFTYVPAITYNFKF